MSMFPTIGSTVTNVSTTKTGTAARIDFSDGSSIYVKYEAVVLERPNDSQPIIRSVKPIVHENSSVSRVEKHFANLPKTQKISKPVYRAPAVTQQVEESHSSILDNPAKLQEAVMVAKMSSQDRLARLSKPFEDNSQSEAAMLASLNGGM